MLPRLLDGLPIDVSEETIFEQLFEAWIEVEVGAREFFEQEAALAAFGPSS